jgi:two-component system, cell cycle sensor histidine kinase and response regulator CckA
MPAPDPVRVLIVDDDEGYVEFIRGILTDVRGQQFAIAHVTYLSRVLWALQEHKASVLLLDVQLPDGNGLDWLRQNRAYVRAEVIVMTGHADFDLDEEVAPGAQDFLPKNEIDRHQLIRALRYAADRHRTQAQLVRSREYFQSLIDHARHLITVVDHRGIILYQSPSSISILGLPPEDVVERSLAEFISQDDVPRARALLAAALEGNVEGAAGEFEVFHSDGSMRIIDVVASRIPSDGPRPWAVLNSRDITERRQALDKLRVRDEQLRQAQKMEAVGRLAGGIAHDFSNVLTVITAATERLRDRVGDQRDTGGDIDTILRNCERAASLTRQLLAFSRQQTLAPRPIDLTQLLKRSSRLLKRLIGEHIVLTLDLPAEVMAVEADPTQIEQVMMNLAINARDAMGSGGVLKMEMRRVTVDEEFTRRHAPMTPGDWVQITVSDTGGGMTRETAAHAFEPFFTTKHPTQGTGLGLSTVYGIIKQSGGFIWLESEVGRGTTFTIYLPPTTAKPRMREKPKAASPATMAPATILLAEDEDEVRELLRDLLESHGHTVLEANGPAEGIKVADAYDGHIDLLLTDVVMPGGTGVDLSRALLERRPDTKVLYMSGYPEIGGSHKTILEPGVPFLSKPFTRDVLLAKLHELLDS